jgi:hypothetical protein
MIDQHEEERRRISLELHDETAQVFSAVKLQLGLLRERVAGDEARGLERALALVDEGMRSIRNVTETLRPTVLDDLGLLPALRSLAISFEGQCGIEVSLDAPDEPPLMSQDAELALFGRCRRRCRTWRATRRGLNMCGPCCVKKEGRSTSTCATMAMGGRCRWTPNDWSARDTWGWPACASASVR